MNSDALKLLAGGVALLTGIVVAKKVNDARLRKQAETMVKEYTKIKQVQVKAPVVATVQVNNQTIRVTEADMINGRDVTFNQFESAKKITDEAIKKAQRS